MSPHTSKDSSLLKKKGTSERVQHAGGLLLLELLHQRGEAMGAVRLSRGDSTCSPQLIVRSGVSHLPLWGLGQDSLLVNHREHRWQHVPCPSTKCQRIVSVSITLVSRRKHEMLQRSPGRKLDRPLTCENRPVTVNSSLWSSSRFDPVHLVQTCLVRGNSPVVLVSCCY